MMGSLVTLLVAGGHSYSACSWEWGIVTESSVIFISPHNLYSEPHNLNLLDLLPLLHTKTHGASHRRHTHSFGVVCIL